MHFKTINMIRHGTEKVWKTMRDDLPDLAVMIDEIESITETERSRSETIHHVVNIWKAAIRLPQIIMSVLGSDLFVWTDRAEWNDKTHTCFWTIELHQFRDLVQCSGTTIFEPAMGGSGTKITFSGNIEWKSNRLAGMPGMFGEAFFSVGADFIQSNVQKNFRKLADAVAKYLDKK